MKVVKSDLKGCIACARVEFLRYLKWSYTEKMMLNNVLDNLILGFRFSGPSKLLVSDTTYNLLIRAEKETLDEMVSMALSVESYKVLTDFKLALS
jgi:hypothetical protein